MKKCVLLILVVVLSLFSCKTIDVETVEKKSLAEENKELKEALDQANESLSQAENALTAYVKDEEYVYDIEPRLVPVNKYIVVDKNDYSNTKEVKGRDAVKESFKDSSVELKDYTGGVSEFDYDENYQFPIFTKKLSMTTIILNKDEVMTTDDVFLSDSKSWEIVGDIWTTQEGERQLIMIKPLKEGLETDMLVVTNKRLYKFILYSTKSDYQPMVKFNYKEDKHFVTSNTKKAKPEKTVTAYDEVDESLVSYNYKIQIPVFQRKTGFVPELVYDDGSFTYIKFSEEVLQKEMPVIYENSRDIVNYEIHPSDHSLLIINKLITKVTIRLGKQKITVVKKKGEPLDLTLKR